MRDVGPVALYDTAFRLGGYLGYLPSRVYLHGGTCEGAKALAPLGKVNHRAESIGMDDLPPTFRKLQAYEVEDCLCIYKEAIRHIVSRTVSR